MPHPHTSSLPLPPVSLADKITAARQQGERGRKMILLGWLIAMLGVAGYCRAILRVGTDAEFLDAVTQTGALGWGSALLILGGVGLWLAGNLIYLREAMDVPDSG